MDSATSVPVTLAVPERLPLLADVLGRALSGDPIFQWPFGGRGSVEEIAEVAHRLYRQPVDAGMVWEGGDGEGVAVWVPPGGAALLAASGPSGTAGLPINSRETRRRQQIWEWLGTFVAEDAWYLETLGVDPSSQRTGVGTALTRHGLELAAASGTVAFLETSVASNVPYYQRLGFNVVDEADAPGGGPHVWFMRSDPSEAGPAAAHLDRSNLP